MEALMLDVKNYDAFRELVEGGMMTAQEGEWNVHHLMTINLRCGAGGILVFIVDR